jgi:hypothetical protein
LAEVTAILFWIATYALLLWALKRKWHLFA